MCKSPKPQPMPEVRQVQETKQAEQSSAGASDTRKAATNNSGGMAGSTMLTGADGVKKKDLQLGNNTLLGQ